VTTDADIAILVTLQAFQLGPLLQRSQYLVRWVPPSRVGVGRPRGHCRLAATPSFERLPADPCFRPF
jgi:hypothetical protein